MYVLKQFERFKEILTFITGMFDIEYIGAMATGAVVANCVRKTSCIVYVTFPFPMTTENIISKVAKLWN